MTPQAAATLLCLSLSLLACGGPREPSTGTPAPTTTGATVVSIGTLAGRDGHSGMGSVTLSRAGDEHELCFEANFDVTDGPDLIVFLTPRSAIGSAGALATDVNFGTLLADKGRQCYRSAKALPAGALHAWVYCRRYTEEFASAPLTPQ